ncbi:MAG: GAF domain-containing protein [Hyphomicrobiales bacterium]
MTAVAQGVAAPVVAPKAKARRKMALSLKFAAAFIGLVSVVLIVNGFVNLWLSYDEAKRAAVRVQQEKAQAAAERISLFASDIESQMGWTTRAEWAHIPVEQRRYDFIRLLRQAPPITELIQVDGAGKEQLKLSRLEPDVVASGADYSADPRFTNAVAEHVWFSPVYFRRGSEPYMTISVAHAGRTPGATIAEVNLKLIWDVVTSIRIGDKGYAYIVNAQGKLVAHPDMSLVLRDTDLSHMPQVANALAAPQQGAQASTAETGLGLDGSSVLTAYAGIPRLNWIVFVQLPLSEALAPVYASLLQTGALLGLGLLLASVMGTLLARRMVVPIRRLQQGAERLGAGELGQRIDIRTGDEIETLADRFNQMAGKIQESYETLEAKVDERTRDLNEALQQQTATAEVLKVISRSTFDLQTVLDALVASAARLCEADKGVIFLREEDRYRMLSNYGFSAEFEAFARANPFPADTGSTTSRAAVSGGIVQVVDVLADDTRSELAREYQRLGGFRTNLGVPLLREGVPIGVFTLTRQEVKAFTPRQIELVQTFADQAVIAIENVRLFEEVQARTRDLGEALQQQTATADVLKVISRSAFDLKSVLTTLTESARTLCGAATGVVFLRDGDVMRVQAESGCPPAFIDFLRANPIRPGRETFTGRVFMSGEVSHLPDVLADPEYSFGAAPQIGEFRSALGVPLMRDGRVEGVFSLARPEPGAFTPRQIELVQTFADQAVIAIENVRLFEKVEARTKELAQSLEELRAMQDRLIQSEKLASLGQLTAGIAHEIKNPLNFVNNFAALSGELIEELRELLEGEKLGDKIRGEIDELTQMLKGNLEKVVQHGKRADSIVKNMLLHSREGSGEHRPVDLNAIVEESLNLAYHGARAEKPGFNITLVKNLDPAVGEVDLYPQEFTRVLLNLISNGFYAATKRKAQGDGAAFEPTLTASTRNLGDKVEIKVRDNGTGIPAEVKAKMFNPFFTTKPAGEGTGLGLSLSFDIIVKQHGGTIDVDTKPGEFTEFTILLPRGSQANANSGRKQ